MARHCMWKMRELVPPPWRQRMRGCCRVVMSGGGARSSLATLIVIVCWCVRGPLADPKAALGGDDDEGWSVGC